METLFEYIINCEEKNIIIKTPNQPLNTNSHATNHKIRPHTNESS